jgi:hypothetical protein
VQSLIASRLACLSSLGSSPSRGCDSRVGTPHDFGTIAALNRAGARVSQNLVLVGELAAKRKLQLIVVMTLGSTLLLTANLISEKPAPQAETSASSDEAAAAARLVELAIRESKALGDGKADETGEAPAPPETQA